MNYKEAMRYFKYSAIDEVKVRFVNDAAREKSQSNIETLTIKNVNKRLKEVITDDSFILIDGPSCSGKTTLGEKLKKQFNATVLDIDLISLEYFDSLVKKNPLMALSYFQNFDEITDKYLEENMEKLVSKAKQKGKPVILIGHFVTLIARTVILSVLAKDFHNKISLFCYEPNKKRFIEAVNKRNNINSKYIQNSVKSEIYLSPFREYDETTYILDVAPEAMGIGVDTSMMLDFSSIEAIK